MTAEKDVVYAQMAEEGVRIIYLNQPRKKNAISARMMDLLADLLDAADADDDVRAIVLRGEGDNFSSGGDLNQNGPDDAGPETARKTLRHYGHAIRAMRRTCKPVIAMVDGYAVGGAFSLALASDLVCAADTACFIPAFCQIGIIPEMAMMKHLPELVGPQRAKEILFLGGKISAQQMNELGLVNRLCSHEELQQQTMELACAVASMPSASIQITKGIMNSLADGTLDTCLEAELTASPFCTTTADFAATREKFAK